VRAGALGGDGGQRSIFVVASAGQFVGIGLRFGIVRFDFRDGIDPVAMVGDAIQLQIIHVFEGNRQFPRIGLIGIMRAAVDG